MSRGALRARTVPAILSALLVATAMASIVSPARAQAIPTRGRFSLYGGWSDREGADGAASDLYEAIATVSLQGAPGAEGRLEYGVDARVATYPSSDRDQRLSIYEAFVGLRSRGGRWSARLGQLWVHELGGLGSVGGVHGELRLGRPSPLGQLRLGVLAGLEPERYDGGFVEDVRKGGVYAALDASGGRRHVLGYVTVRNSGLTERSVIVFNNSIPVGRTFSLYQALEYDTQGPGGLGDAELSYLFANLRFTPTQVVGLQGTYHRGRSIDARGITQDQLEGRPVAPEALEGLVFESGRLRVSLRANRDLTVWVSVGQDRTTREDEPRDRLQAGLVARRLFGSGLDVSLSGTRSTIGDDTYDSLHASIGASLGTRTYLTLDYSDAFAVYHRTGADGGVVTERPDSRRYSLTCNLDLSRMLSLLLVAEITDDDAFDERRLMTGLVVRF